LAGKPGFLAHGDADPGRRSDPGTEAPNLFPWDEFLAFYRIEAVDLLGGGPAPNPTPTPKDGFLMALTDAQHQRHLDLAEANELRQQSNDQRLARIEHALNTDGNDKGADGKAKASYPVRILQGVQTLLDRKAD